MRYENEVTNVLYWVSLPVSLRRQSLTRPLGPDVVGTKIKIREYPVDGQRLFYRLQSSRPQVIVPKAEPREGGVEGQRLSDRPPRPGLQPPAPTPASLSWKALEYTMGAMNGVHFSTEVGSCT